MLTVYTLEESEQWDAAVKSFSEYDVYYLSGYARSFALHGDGDPLLFWYRSENLQGIHVVMKRDVAKATCFAGKLPEQTYFDFCSPYGYAGWLTEGTGDADQLMAEYDDWCRENHIAAEFVRLHPCMPQPAFLQTHYQVVPLGNTIAMELDSPEYIWSNLSSKNRNMIRKAQKNGLTTHQANTPESYAVFQELYRQTMDRDQADAYYYFAPAFYDCLRQQLKDNCRVFYTTTADGEVASAAIILNANQRLHYHLSGSRKDLQHLAPTNLLLYEVAAWGSENGYKTLHLGGGVGAKEDSLYAFKKAFFRGAPKQYCIAKRIIDNTTYNKLVELRGEINNRGFFPAYRG